MPSLFIVKLRANWVGCIWGWNQFKCNTNYDMQVFTSYVEYDSSHDEATNCNQKDFGFFSVLGHRRGAFPAEDKSKIPLDKICYHIQFICICPNQSLGLWLKHIPKWFTYHVCTASTHNMINCYWIQRVGAGRVRRRLLTFIKHENSSNNNQWPTETPAAGLMRVRCQRNVLPRLYQFDVVNLDVLCSSSPRCKTETPYM